MRKRIVGLRVVAIVALALAFCEGCNDGNSDSNETSLHSRAAAGDVDAAIKVSKLLESEGRADHSAPFLCLAAIDGSKAALARLQEVAKRNDAAGLYELGRYYNEGEGNAQKAMDYYIRGAEESPDGVCFTLAWMVLFCSDSEAEEARHRAAVVRCLVKNPEAGWMHLYLYLFLLDLVADGVIANPSTDEFRHWQEMAAKTTQKHVEMLAASFRADMEAGIPRRERRDLWRKYREKWAARSKKRTTEEMGDVNCLSPTK